MTVIALREVAMPENVSKENWMDTFSSKSPPPYVPTAYGDPDRSPLKFTVEPKQGNIYDMPIPAAKRKQR